VSDDGQTLADVAVGTTSEYLVAERQSDTGMAGPNTSHGDQAAWCRGCGARNPPQMRFCGTCGEPLAESDDARAVADPLIGLLVGGRYRIEARIGSGGMGAVYRVMHEQLEKAAAMKLLHGDLARDASMVRRFVREAKAVSRLTNTNTVSVFDFGKSGGLVYLVMELLTGRDLGRVLVDEGPLSATRVARVVEGVAASLSEAHSLGIVHRDLKPQNIFFNQRPGELDEVKVLDFGLAKILETREETIGLTQVGTVLGTPHYMSPEQIEDRPIDQRSDIYSLGTVCFRLLTGEPPFNHTSPIGILHRHLIDEVPRMADATPALAALDPVLAKSMSKSADDRYASVDEFAAAFVAAVGKMSHVAHTPQVIARPDPHVAEVNRTRIGTRREFERFELRLRAQRLGTQGLLSLGVVGALAGVALAAAHRDDWLPVRESEPNDSVTGAADLPLGRLLNGRITPPRTSSEDDRDFVRIQPVDGLSERIDIELQGSDGLFPQVTAFDSNGSRIAVVQAGADGRVRLAGLPGSGDGLLVEIAGMGTMGEYELRAVSRPAYLREEREPNGQVSRAGALWSGLPVVGTIGWPEDTDMYRLPSDVESGRFDYELSGPSGASMSLTVEDAQGRILYSASSTPGPTRTRGTFEINAQDGVGAPLIRVAASGAFDRHLSYDLSVTLRDSEGNDAEEPAPE
jgi:tRNA A-37 threonylcarbamoyl transferase component Bud32